MSWDDSSAHLGNGADDLDVGRRAPDLEDVQDCNGQDCDGQWAEGSNIDQPPAAVSLFRALLCPLHTPCHLADGHQ